MWPVHVKKKSFRCSFVGRTFIESTGKPRHVSGKTYLRWGFFFLRVCFLNWRVSIRYIFQLASSRLMERHRQSEREDWAIKRATRVPELSQSLMMAQRHRDLPDITAALTSTQRRHFPSDGGGGGERSSYPNYPLLPAPLPHSTWAPHFSSSLSFISLVSGLTPLSFSTRLLSVALSIPP